MKESGSTGMITEILCEDSAEGIFSAVYFAYEQKMNPNTTVISSFGVENYTLFREYLEVEPDLEKAEKVQNTIRKRFGNTTSFFLWSAVYSHQKNKADIIYHTIARGLAGAYRGELTHYLQDPYILELSKIQKNVWNEAHHFKGFLRFAQLKNGIYFSKIKPKNNILPLIAGYFNDRMGQEKFMIYDEKYHLCLVHEPGQETTIYVPGKEEEEILQRMQEFHSEEEREMQKMFQTFYDSITIESRKNPALQRNNLPLRFRENMVEFSSSLRE